MRRILGVALLVACASVPSLAAPPATPEIDASTGIAAIALLAGGLLVVRYRTKK